MDAAMASQTVPDFAAAGNKEIYGEQVSVPDVVGMTQDVATSTLKGAGFQVKVAKDQATDYRPAGTVVDQSATGKAPKRRSACSIRRWPANRPFPKPTTSSPWLTAARAISAVPIWPRRKLPLTAVI